MMNDVRMKFVSIPRRLRIEPQASPPPEDGIRSLSGPANVPESRRKKKRGD